MDFKPIVMATYIFIYVSGGDEATGASYTANAWHHVVGTYDGTNKKLYMNGSLIDTVSESGAIDNDDVSLTIGAREDGMDWYFNGNIDDAKIYSRALTQAEVTRNYNAGKRSHR